MPGPTGMIKVDDLLFLVYFFARWCCNQRHPFWTGVSRAVAAAFFVRYVDTCVLRTDGFAPLCPTICSRLCETADPLCCIILVFVIRFLCYQVFFFVGCVIVLIFCVSCFFFFFCFFVFL